MAHGANKLTLMIVGRSNYWLQQEIFIAICDPGFVPAYNECVLSLMIFITDIIERVSVPDICQENPINGVNITPPFRPRAELAEHRPSG